MGRKSLITVILAIAIVRLTAQNGNFEFVENKGQWESVVKFKGELSSGAFFLHANGFTVLQHNVHDLEMLASHAHGLAGKRSDKGRNENEDKINSDPHAPVTLHSHAYRVVFDGANANPEIVPDRIVSSYNNYFIGNDPSKWARKVKIFQGITYKNIYPNIDVRYYSDNGTLKYDIIVRPGGDLSNVVMRYEGANQLSIKNRELVIKTSVGDVHELSPYSYEYGTASPKKVVDAKYHISNGNRVQFSVKEYDPSHTLVIDPTLIFSSFTGSAADNWGFTATPAPDGSFYAGGIVFGQGFPVTPGAFERTFQGGKTSRPIDMGIMKFSPNGSQRLFATYVGGDGDDLPHSLYSDGQGDLVILGRSYSTNYPGTFIGPTKTGGDCDVVVTKLTADGSNIIGSLRIGGDQNDGVNVEDIYETQVEGGRSLIRNYGDESRSEVVLDPAGNIYVAAQTQSTGGTAASNFPMIGGAFQSTPGGAQDGVVMKINPTCTAVTWSSFLGGNNDDGAFVLDINPATGNIYVAGGTVSKNFPGVGAGVINPAYVGGESDGFVSIISNDGKSLIKSTFLGTPSIDLVYGIKFDRFGFPYVMGITRGTWPVTPGATAFNPNSKQFIAKLQQDLSAYVYSTVFGSGASQPNISPVAFLVDRCENVYVSGWGGWLLPGRTDPYDQAGAAGMPITPDAIKKLTDNKDFYFIVIKKNSSALLYATYFGQDGGLGEHVDGGTSRYDAQGVIYQAICANCSGGAVFPTSPGVIGPVNGASRVSGCNLAAVKISFNFAGVGSGPIAIFNGLRDTVGCVPFTVTFADTVRNAKRYEWSFGDGSPDEVTTSVQLSHTFGAIGTYLVRLIAIDSTTCNIRDTAYVHILVRDDKANLAYNVLKLPPCESLAYRFTNLSTAPATKPFQPQSFTWDFGDGTTVVSGPGTLDHSFAAPGTYIVKLTLTDTNYCNAPDVAVDTLRIAPNVVALFDVPLAGCAPYDAVFSNVSQAGQQFTWDFGDGTTSTDVNPVHLYPAIGTYTVRLIAVDTNTCNKIDSLEKVISVNPRPTADFNFGPVPPEINKPTVFTNLATGGVRYKWLFGDGDSTTKTNTDTVVHQYNATNLYNACLIVYNQFNCTDTMCKLVESKIVPVFDVPNAFTPGRAGQNSVVYVAGFGIGRMIWRIYNRWGQVVFETNNRKGGWDGTFKGQPQPMDVYAYTLDIEFTDGSKARKTGDITLIR